MRRLTHVVLWTTIAVVAAVASAPALADTPTVDKTTMSFGPFRGRRNVRVLVRLQHRADSHDDLRRQRRHQTAHRPQHHCGGER
jgi:hypothetical protein